MTLHRLKIYRSVAKHLNLTKASRELHISEPSVYQQLKILQEEMNLRLYRKNGRGIALTEEGQLFLADAEAILDRVEKLMENAKSGSYKGALKTLKIGASYGPSASCLPVVSKAFQERHPNVQANLSTHASPVIEQMVLDSHVEFGITTSPPGFAALVYERFQKEEIVAFAAREHPIANKTNFSLQDFTPIPIVLFRRFENRPLRIENALRQLEALGVKLSIAMICDTPEAVKACVSRGVGVGILYRSIIEDEIDSGALRIIDLPAFPIKIDGYIVYHRERPLSAYARDFIALLRRYRFKATPVKILPLVGA